MPSVEVTALRSLLERTAGDSEGSETKRARQLRDLRDDLASLLGQADSLLGDAELRIEGGAMERRYTLLRARAKADTRERLISEGKATPEALDELGYLSHDRLDALEADGTLEATLAEYGGRR